jgi:hypothetical protein
MGIKQREKGRKKTRKISLKNTVSTNVENIKKMKFIGK